jgi:hypothetical protein
MLIQKKIDRIKMRSRPLAALRRYILLERNFSGSLAALEAAKFNEALIEALCAA